MPLTYAALGEPAVIQRVGGSQEVRQHLRDLGFVPGGRVMVVSVMGGNLIVNVKETRIAISQEMARRITVA